MKISSFCLISLVVMATWSFSAHAKKRILIGSLINNKNPTAKFAQDIASNSSQLRDFLDEYDVTIEEAETHGSIGLAFTWIAHWLTCKQEKALLLLGPEKTEEVEIVSVMTRFSQKPMVTYLATFAKDLRQTNKYFMGLASTMRMFNDAKQKMMAHFQWKRAAVIYDFADDGGIYAEVVTDLASNASFDLIGIESIAIDLNLMTTSVGDESRTKLEKLKNQDTKIFFGEFGPTGASIVFCEVYKLNLFGRGYVWIIHYSAGMVEQWLKQSERIYEKKTNSMEPCTREEYEQAAAGVFYFDKMDYRMDADTPTDSGLTVKEVFSHLEFQGTKESDIVKVTTAFDAIWTVYLAMKNASMALKKENLTLETNVTRTSAETDTISKALMQATEGLNFEGLTGPVFFNNDQQREGLLILKQIRANGTVLRVGEYFTHDKIFKLYNATANSLFKDNNIPRDRSREVLEMTDVSPALFIVFSIAASIGTILGIAFLVFNRYYRQYKFVRLSAPLFNDIIVLGCIMCLSTVILFGLRNVGNPEVIIPRICKARAWTLTIGFSLAFGAMFIKTWRIYKICTNKRLKVRLGPLSDWWMLAMIGVVVVIDVAMLLAWELVDPLKRGLHKFPTKSRTEDPDRPFDIIVPAINTCTAQYLSIWLTLIYVFKGILLLYGLFLAYETRNVVYAHLNDSRVIGICVYNVVVLSTIGAFLALILTDDQYQQLYAALSVCITFPATATISLIFMPKLVHRVKASSLDDETGPTTMGQTVGRTSLDMSSTVGYQTEMNREKFVDRPSNNTLSVYKNDEPILSTTPSPPPLVAEKDNPAVVLED